MLAPFAQHYGLRFPVLEADRALLDRTGGLAIYLGDRSVRTVAENHAGHPWWDRAMALRDAARVLRESDPALAARALEVAKDDWAHAIVGVDGPATVAALQRALEEEARFQAESYGSEDLGEGLAAVAALPATTVALAALMGDTFRAPSAGVLAREVVASAAYVADGRSAGSSTRVWSGRTVILPKSLRRRPPSLASAPTIWRGSTLWRRPTASR